MRAKVVKIAVLLVVGPAFLGSAQSSGASRFPDLRILFRDTHWVAYAPTNYDPQAQPPKIPGNGSIREDLSVLRRAGCDGLVTYGASLPQVVDIAQAVGFKAILLGVWDPASEEELRLAASSAENRIVVGVIVGNEGLMFKRYTASNLKEAMDSVRKVTRKPVATTEVVDAYYTKPELIEWSDFLAVNAHPFFHGKRQPDDAAEWTWAVWKRLRERVPADKAILFKEVGLPSAGEPGLTEQAQKDYYFKLRKTDVQFVFFEAFDAMFKRGPVEQSWGLFRADRSPKPAAAAMAKGMGQ